MVDAPSRETLVFIYDRHTTITTGVMVAHLQACRTRADAEGWEVGGVFVDTGPTDGDEDRPAFETLLDAMRAAGDHWNVVCLVANWNRFSCDPDGQAAFRARVRAVGGYTATSGGEDDQADSEILQQAAGTAQ